MTFKKLLTLTAAILCAGSMWAQKDVTSQYITNATLSSLDGWTNVNFNSPQRGNNTEGYAIEAYAGWGSLEKTNYSLKQTITLPAGNYTLVNYSFYRYGLDYYTDATKSLAYLVAGDDKVAVKTLGSITAAGYANSQAEGANAFDSKMYRNTLDFTIAADNTEITIGLEGTHDLKQSWMICGMFELINNDIAATMDSPFDVTGYITNPGFEYRDMTGWTLSESEAFGTQNNEQSFKVGGYYAEKWQQAASGALTARNMSQTLTNLPAGLYRLTANLGGDGTYVDVNGKTANWTADGDYTVGYVLAENENLVITAGKTAEGTANWIHFDNFRLKFCGDVAAALTTLCNQVTDYNGTIPTAAYTQLQSDVAAKNITYSDVDELLAAIDAVQALYDAADVLAEAYAAYNAALSNANTTAATTAKMAPSVLSALQNAISTYATVDETSVSALTEAANALNAAADLATKSIASYAILASGVIPDNSLEGWVCENTNTFHINKWSEEGNPGNDPSGMVTPFIENWVAKGSYLGAGRIYYKLEGVEPGEQYYASALIRSYNEASSDAPNGPDFFINDQTSSLSEAGTTFTYNNMSGIYATVGATTTVGADGTLTLGVQIPASPNFNWVAFKSVKFLSLAAIKVQMQEKVNEAKALLAYMPTDYKSSFTATAITPYDGQTLATFEAYNTAISTIQDALDDAADVVSNYKAYLALKDYADALVAVANDNNEANTTLGNAINTAATDVETKTTATDIATINSTLKTAMTTYATTANPTGEGKFNLTFLMTNPDVTGMSGVPAGWVTEQSDGNFGVTTNAARTGYSPAYCVEYWSDPAKANNAFALYNKVENLPAGTYTMSCYAFANANGVAGATNSAVYFYANETQGSLVSADVLTEASISFVNATEGDVKIGLKALTGNEFRWMGIGYVELYKVPAQTYTVDENVAWDNSQSGAGDVTLNRTIRVGYNTLVLPFSMTQTEVENTFGTGSKVYVVGSYENEHLAFVTHDDGISANQPCLLKATEAGTSYTIEGRTIVAGTPSYAGTNVTMTGSYAASLNAPTDSYIFSGDALYVVDSKVEMKGTRAYITLETGGSAPSRLTWTVDGEATAISGINTEDRTVNGAIYNLQGQQLNGLQRGINIVNGKKVLVK